MRLSDFDYILPPEHIAKTPLTARDQSRLLALDVRDDRLTQHIFYEIARLFRPGDVLVLNNTKVLKARLVGRKATGGKIEILLLKQLAGADWQALAHPSYKVKQGAQVEIEAQKFFVELLDAHQSGSGLRCVRLCAPGYKDWRTALDQKGHMPLPPYLKRPARDEDFEQYQTVFAETEGAVAAPTAGLHFTPALLDRLKKQGVSIVYITLHVGYGTFKPVTAELLSEHEMHAESFAISPEAAVAINQRKGRLIACGTTALRTLESAADERGRIYSRSGETNLFIYPPYTFKSADALITNFHLPRSTLLMLVSAFAGHDLIMRAYEEAKRNGYRFYSYGDAMWIDRTGYA